MSVSKVALRNSIMGEIKWGCGDWWTQVQMQMAS